MVFAPLVIETGSRSRNDGVVSLQTVGYALYSSLVQVHSVAITVEYSYRA